MYDAPKTPARLQITFFVFVLVGFIVVFLLCSVGAVRSAITLAAATAVMAHVFFSRWGRMNFAAANMKVISRLITRYGWQRQPVSQHFRRAMSYPLRVFVYHTSAFHRGHGTGRLVAVIVILPRR